MNMRKLLAFPSLLIFLLPLVGSTQSVPATAMKWLAGKWKTITPEVIITEEWEQKDDSTLTGKSYIIRRNGVPVLQETIELAYRNQQWTYTPTVAGQNNGKPVPFKLIFVGKQEFICENPEHDFPQRINYRRKGNELLASIEGKRNGKFSIRHFDYTLD